MFRIESYITPIVLSYIDKYVKDFKPQDAQVSYFLIKFSEILYITFFVGIAMGRRGGISKFRRTTRCS